MVLSNERTGPDKTTNCSVVFWKFIQVYISSQCFTLCVYDSTKEQALGISQGGVGAVCIVTEEREGGEQSLMREGRQENG